MILWTYQIGYKGKLWHSASKTIEYVWRDHTSYMSTQLYQYRP